MNTNKQLLGQLLRVGLAVSVVATVAVGCQPKADADGQDKCQTCATQGKAPVACVFDIAGQIAHQANVVCIGDAENEADVCDQACDDFNLEGNGVCEDVVRIERFACDGFGYDTDGFPTPTTSQTSGADETSGLDETGVEAPAWEPALYVEHSTVDDRFIIQRELLEALEQEPALLALDNAVLVPRSAGGYQFSGIEPGSLAQLLGFQNGDSPLSVDGQDATTLEGAILAMDIVRQADKLTVKLERSSQIVVLKYGIE